MFFKRKPLLDFRHYCKLSWYAISRKTNDPNLRKMTKNLVPIPILASLAQSWDIIFFFKICFCQPLDIMHCMKSVRIRSFSGPYFPAFGLNTDRYSVSLRIQNVGKCGPKKLWVRIFVAQRWSVIIMYHIRKN